MANGISDKIKAAYVIRLFNRYDFYAGYINYKTLGNDPKKTPQEFVNLILNAISELNFDKDIIGNMVITYGCLKLKYRVYDKYPGTKLTLSCGDVGHEVNIKKMPLRYSPKTRLVIDDNIPYIFSNIDKTWYSILELDFGIRYLIRENFSHIETIDSVDYYKPN